MTVTLVALPGTFCTPDRPLARLSGLVASTSKETRDALEDGLRNAFRIAGSRLFEQDPRFGLIVLSEIASRALSPAVNDPGTAIDIIGTLVRLLHDWVAPSDDDAVPEVLAEHVFVPALTMGDIFDDAFTGIARDGAGTVEVMVRLQKALEACTAFGDRAMREEAVRHARLALRRAELAMTLDDDVDAVRSAAAFTRGDSR